MSAKLWALRHGKRKSSKHAAGLLLAMILGMGIGDIRNDRR